MSQYDAILLLSFGGPEGPDDVMPFLERVVQGRDVPRERLLAVAGHYALFGGKSPLSDANRVLSAALQAELDLHGPRMPVYWGNRNWHPLLEETLAEMERDGVRRALCVVTSAFGSYPGCRQYAEDIARARGAVGDGSPEVDKVRTFHNHPVFIDCQVDRAEEALAQVPDAHRVAAALVFTAHSIPVAMASDSPYQLQLRDTCSLVSERLFGRAFDLVYQSRSGPAAQPWLEPDLFRHLEVVAARGQRHVVIVPVGFLSDHMEVVYDLDIEAADLARALGLSIVRAGTVGTHPKFVTLLRELILERVDPGTERRSVGPLGPSVDVCAAGCCPAPSRRQRPPSR